jgi:3-deoxy-7-phosphoheptulonate synthase
MLELPISTAQQQFIEKTRHEIKQIIEGKDPRLLLIVGPCSIHDTIAAKEYARKLHALAQSVSDTFLIVMRVYFEKPRTTLGWKGFLYDPWLDGSHDIPSGIRMTRRLLLDLAELEIPTAAEFLDISSAYYFGDLLSWGCIGARTAASQTHRQVASGLSMPVAFKNSTDGNVDIAINGVINASSPHTFIGMNAHGRLSTVHTSGNTHGHIVLRGGESKPNYDPESISYTLERLQKANLPACLLIDCAHDNSSRKHEQQALVFQSIINQIVEGNREIRGALLESHLFSGNQPMTNASQLKYAVSLTDPCLNWETTEHLIRWGGSMLKKERCHEKKSSIQYCLSSQESPDIESGYAHLAQEVK